MGCFYCNRICSGLNVYVKMATGKRKRVSKKTKKSWRKNVNIDDVEDFLDDKRLEERTGLKLSELPDDELFEICTTAYDAEKDLPFQSTKIKEITNSLRLRETTTPKGFAILEKRSAVKDPIIKRNRIKTREEKRHPAVKKIFQERLEKGILTAKQKRSIADKIKAAKERKNKSKIPEFKYDLWDSENKNNLKDYEDWLSSESVKHNINNTGPKQVKPPKSITMKNSFLPAIETPHPGISYNPSVKDHKEILSLVAEAEMNMVKEEKHIKRVTTDMFSKVNQKQADLQWFTEMTDGLVDTKDEEEVMGDYATVNPPVKNKKKTLQKRRKLREAAQLQAQIRQKKLEKKKIADIYKLRKFNASFKKEEFKQKKEKEKREEQKKLKPYQTKTLSKVKYEEPLLDFNLAEELSGNLRGLKANANLLKDRYSSLQKRNILEPAVKHHPKKIKKKRYERGCTKMGWEPKGY